MDSLKTLFIITVSTARLIFPGLPAATGVTDTAPPPAVRSLSLEIASDAPAGSSSKASVVVPEGLKAGKTLDLQIDLSALPISTTTAADSKLKVFSYWGSAREVPAGQPKTSGSKSAAEAIPGMPTKSYASWPTFDSKPLSESAAIPGTYTLKTDYCGTTSVTLTQDQGFLAPVSITSATGQPDLTKPIVIRWKPVDNAVGYLLRAYGGHDNQTITWTSSADLQLAEGIEYRPLGKDDLDKLTKSGVLIPSYVISSTIPAGIFKGSPSVMLIMTAFGKDMDQIKDGIETQVIVRSTASLPLHSTPYGTPPPPKNANRDISE